MIMSTKKKDPLYEFLCHLNHTNSKDRNYQVYKHRTGIQILMNYLPSGVYDLITALADVYQKNIDFTAQVEIIMGPDEPPNIKITILPTVDSWVFELVNKGDKVCDLDTLVGYYDTYVDPHPARREVLERIK